MGGFTTFINLISKHIVSLLLYFMDLCIIETRLVQSSLRGPVRKQPSLLYGEGYFFTGVMLW